MSETLEQCIPQASGEDIPFSVPLELTVEDRDTIRALVQYAEGPERDDYALEALKIGVLALRHAAGALDTEFIQRETTRLVETLDQRLDTHARQAHDRLATSLKEYFDPEDGRFSQRVRRLTSDDGELSHMLRGMFDGENSQLAKTLLSHVGETSPLMKVLDPDQSQGLIAVVRSNVQEQLTQQRERLLKEFSLDNSDGALFRLIGEISAKHGDFTKNMQSKIDEVVKEFSLDEENSALSRLVGNVDHAQRRITQEFSLDNKQSALHKLKEELTTILSAHVKTNAEFQREVMVALGKLVTKRETELEGTQHGGTFQEAVFELISRESQKRGDTAEDTGDRVGLMKGRRVGDIVVHLGEDNTAAGERIVLEAKEDKSYTLAKAKEEMEVARKNRGAQAGVFVFSRRTAPAQLESLARYGENIVVVWDAEDSASDAYLKAGLEIARALCVRTRRSTDQAADFVVIDKAILDIEKRAQNLDQIRTSAETIESSSQKILKRVATDKKALEKQLQLLREAMDDLKQLQGASAGDDLSTPSAT